MIGSKLKTIRISGRQFAATIVLELALIAVAAWIADGVPGLRRDQSPPSVTIQFAPHPAPAAITRAYNI